MSSNAFSNHFIESLNVVHQHGIYLQSLTAYLGYTLTTFVSEILLVSRYCLERFRPHLLK